MSKTFRKFLVTPVTFLEMPVTDLTSPPNIGYDFDIVYLYLQSMAKSKLQSYQSEYYRRNQERIKAAANARYHHKAKQARVEKEYGITLEAAEDIWKAQLGQCATCRQDIPKPGMSRRAHIDHDHSSGKVRGILCPQCNMALGLVKDNITTLKNMQRYLETHDV